MFSNSITMMSSTLQQAFILNSNGIGLLASGDARAAFGCFRQALTLLSEASASSEVIDLPPQPENVQEHMQHLILVSLSDMDPAVMTFPNEAILIATSEQELAESMTLENLTLFSAAVIFNCAVAMDRKAAYCDTSSSLDSHLERATRLYAHCLQLLGSSSSGGSSLLAFVDRATRGMASNLYSLGDFGSVRSLFDDLLLLQVSSHSEWTERIMTPTAPSA